MQWFYADNNQPVGPVDEARLRELAQAGKIGLDTLVWRQGMANWRPLSETPLGDAAETLYTCVECGRAQPRDEVIPFRSVHVCAACKPVFFQRVREGTLQATGMQYAGFWLRAGAKIIDAVLLAMLTTTLHLGLSGLLAQNDPFTYMLVSGLIALASFAANITYATWFVGRYAATLGKMAFGLRVITGDGSSVSYLRALGRALGEIVSGMVLYLGYLIAVFDDQNRTLHDFFCDTRVIKE